MDVTHFTQFLVFTLMYHVLSADITSSLANGGSQLCSRNLTQCLPGNITVQISSKNSCATDVNMTCDTNLSPNLIGRFEWRKNQEKLDGENRSTLVQSSTQNKVEFTCTVLSPCGNFNSPSYAIDCRDNAGRTVLIICGVGAIFILLMFGISMKIMLKKK